MQVGKQQWYEDEHWVIRRCYRRAESLKGDVGRGFVRPRASTRAGGNTLMRRKRSQLGNSCEPEPRLESPSAEAVTNSSKKSGGRYI